MPLKIKALNAQSCHDSQAMIQHVTKIDNVGYVTYPPRVQPSQLSAYLECALKANKGKNLKIFTHKPTIAHTEYPGLFLTKFGQLIIPLCADSIQNPFTNGRFRNICIHPFIAQFASMLTQHGLNSRSFNNDFMHFERCADIALSDFKVTCGTRHFNTLLHTWQSTYSSSARRIDNLLEEILHYSQMFEVHSLVIQLKNSSGRLPQFGDLEFRDQSLDEILNEHKTLITRQVWNNRNNNNVIGILSKQEMDIIGDRSIRLIFMVKKEFSDLENWLESPIYNDLSQYFIDTISHRIFYGDIPSMNAGAAPLFQGQHHNFYNQNQVSIGHRLQMLKAQLYGTDYWMRIWDSSTTIKVERRYS